MSMTQRTPSAAKSRRTSPRSSAASTCLSNWEPKPFRCGGGRPSGRPSPAIPDAAASMVRNARRPPRGRRRSRARRIPPHWSPTRGRPCPASRLRSAPGEPLRRPGAGGPPRPPRGAEGSISRSSMRSTRDRSRSGQCRCSPTGLGKRLNRGSRRRVRPPDQEQSARRALLRAPPQA